MPRYHTEHIVENVSSKIRCKQVSMSSDKISSFEERLVENEMISFLFVFKSNQKPSLYQSPSTFSISFSTTRYMSSVTAFLTNFRIDSLYENRIRSSDFSRE